MNLLLPMKQCESIYSIHTSAMIDQSCCEFNFSCNTYSVVTSFWFRLATCKSIQRVLFCEFVYLRLNCICFMEPKFIFLYFGLVFRQTGPSVFSMASENFGHAKYQNIYTIYCNNETCLFDNEYVSKKHRKNPL